METVVCILCTRSEELRLRAKVAIRQTDFGSIRTPNLALDFLTLKDSPDTPPASLSFNLAPVTCFKISGVALLWQHLSHMGHHSNHCPTWFFFFYELGDSFYLYQTTWSHFDSRCSRCKCPKGFPFHTWGPKVHPPALFPCHFLNTHPVKKWGLITRVQTPNWFPLPPMSSCIP